MLKKLLEKKHNLVTKAKALLETAESQEDGFTEEQEQEYAALEAQIEATNKAIKRAEALQAEEKLLPTQKNVNDDTDDEDAAGRTPRIKVGEDPSNKFQSFGEFLGAVVAAGTGERVLDDRLKFDAAAGASEGVASDGGYLVQADFASEIMSKAYATGGILSRVRKVGVSANANGLTMNMLDEKSRVTGSRFGGLQVYWKGEGKNPDATKPKYREMSMKLNKLIGLHYATDELLSDTTAHSQVLQQGMSEEVSFMLENAIVEGTGNGQPLGFRATGANALIEVAKETGQAADTIVFQNIAKMWARMWPRSRPNAVWIINTNIEPQLMELTLPGGTASTPVYLPAGGLSAAPYGTLLGRPVIVSEHAETLGDKGDICLVDLSQYLMIDKGQPKQDFSMHVRFIYDESAFRITYRCNGQPLWDSALTPAKGSDTLSPFITLAARA